MGRKKWGTQEERRKELTRKLGRKSKAKHKKNNKEFSRK